MDKVFRLLLWISFFLLMVRAKFKTLNCQSYDPKIGNFSKCEIKAVSRTKNLINIEYDLYQTIRGNSESQVGFFKRETGWHPFLYSFTVDNCRFLRKPYNIIAILAFGYLKPYANLNRPCPYMANSSISVKSLDLDLDNLRSRFPIPNGEYGLKFSILVNKTKVLSIFGSFYFYDFKNEV